MRRLLIAGLLTAALVWLVPSPVNNSETKAAATTQQARQTNTLGDEHLAKTVEQVEKPAPAPVQETPASQPEMKEAVTVATPAPQPPLTDHEQLMQAAGIQQSDWPAVEYIIMHESSWRPDALNSEGCVGLGQRCPASTLYAECPDLEPVCQLRHFSKYAVSRYGGWQSAYNAWTSKHWW